MRQCPSCSTTEPTAFYATAGSKHIRPCKVCHRKQVRDNCKVKYKTDQNFRSRVMGYAKQRVTARREFIRHYKIEHPRCTDCKIEHAWWRLDFDHTRGKKVLDLSKAAGRQWSEEKILQEIEKCDLLCANCHRDRTHERLQISRSKKASGVRLLSST